MDVTLRPVEPGDEPFLFRVYASTREEELARLSWSLTRRREFLESQFAAQARYLRQEYGSAELAVILCGGQPAGRLYVSRSAREIRILDLALLPDYRGLGVGTHLLELLCDEADAGGKRTVVHLELENRARRLYERLGFRALDERAVQMLMERAPGACPDKV